MSTTNKGQEGEKDTTALLLGELKKMKAEVAALKKSQSSTEVKKENTSLSKFKSCLIPGKKITIVPIRKAPTSLIPGNADEATMLRGSGKSITVPLSLKKNGKLADVLTEEERAYLEDITGLDLNIYSKDSFFKTRGAQIRFKKTGRTIDSAAVTLDLGSAMDFILYKIALTSPRVAKTWKDRHHPQCEFVIKDDAQVLAEKVSKSDLEDTVLHYLLQNKTNKKALFDLLRLYGSKHKLTKQVKRDSSVEWLYQELKSVKDTLKGLRGLYDIISKLHISENTLSRMVLIMDGIESGVLEKRANEYLYKGAVLGLDLEDVIAYLNNPENNMTTLRITTEIENYLKTIK